jgi:MFS family permease
MTTLAVYLPFHFKEIGLAKPELIASTLIGWYVSSTLFSFGYGWVRRHIGVTNAFVISFLLMGISMACAAAATSFRLIAAAIFLGGIGGGIGGPNIIALAANCPADQRALRTGWARAGLFAAPLLVQIPLEPVVQHYGGHGAMFTLAAFGIAMIPVFLWRRRALDAGDQA